ncbi:aldolase/citrate lyase family protein [Halomonas sp. V046]|uniref:aldolase/citrate lyase family protein n=1 Tax=Halomonas sp. V046 TaxID=3459611 RepID=UPI00404410B3
MHLPVNAFRAALGQGHVQFGMWSGFASGYAAELEADLGYDWLLIDGEHAPNSVASILSQLQAVAPYPVSPVVRAVNHDPALIKQLLDIGAQTLMVPMVETEAQAKALVAAMRYPPHGKRGVGGGLVRATRWDDVEDYLADAHQQLCLMAQIESAVGVHNAAAIAAVEGVEAIFIGPADLSSALGHPGNPGHPEVQRAIAATIETVKAAGKAVGILAPGEEDARRYIALGCEFVAVSIDISLLRQAARASLGRFKDDGPAQAPTNGRGASSLY